jgi:hypothetical protein
VGNREAENRLHQLLENPFLVLGVRSTAESGEIERQSQKLLAMLAGGIAEARHYNTPLGPRERTAESVRMAAAELRDPDRRLVHEWWARGWEL